MPCLKTLEQPFIRPTTPQVYPPLSPRLPLQLFLPFSRRVTLGAVGPVVPLLMPREPTFTLLVPSTVKSA